MSGREIFEELRSSGFAVIERWVGEAREESVHLEFKGRARDRSKGQQAAPTDRLDKIDKAVLARAISGLANSDGGVVVLGLDCPQGGGLLPIQSYLAQPAEVARDFQSVSKDITTPAVPGLDVVPVVGADGRGVIAIHAPASGGGPHRANAGDERYYLRTADNTVVMPHHVLAALLSRVPPPRVWVEVVVDWLADGSPQLSVSLANGGRGTAHGVLVAIQRQPNIELRATIGTKPQVHYMLQHVTSVERLPPGFAMPVFTGVIAPVTASPYTFQGAVFVDDAPPLAFELVVTPEPNARRVARTPA